METSDTYKQLMVAWLKRWNAEINALDVKAENATTEAKLRYVVELDVLHTKKRAAAKTLKELESATGEALEKVKLTADEVWNDLGAGIAQAIYKFR